MSQVTAYLPSGYSNEFKEQFKKGIKDLHCTALGFQPHQSSVFIEECAPANTCKNGAPQKLTVLISTTKGKPVEQKIAVIELLDKLVKEMFDGELDTYAVFEEHAADSVCGNGILFSRVKK